MIRVLFIFFILIININKIFGADLKQVPNRTIEPNASISFGIVQVSGNTQTTTLNFNFSYVNKGEVYRQYIDFYALYSESRGKKSAERLEGWARFEKRIMPWFLFWDVDYYRNPFQGYERSLGTGPGIGRYIFKSTKLYLSISYYLYRVSNKLTSSVYRVNNNREEYFLHHIEQRFKMEISSTLRIKEKLIYKQTSRAPEDFFIDFNIAFDNRFSKHLFWETSYNTTYQNRPVGNKIKKQDSTLTASIKYEF